MQKEVFTQRFSSAVAGLEFKEVARKLNVSKSTLKRWIAGTSAPHKLGRESAIVIAEQMKEELLDS